MLTLVGEGFDAFDTSLARASRCRFIPRGPPRTADGASDGGGAAVCDVFDDTELRVHTAAGCSSP